MATSVKIHESMVFPVGVSEVWRAMTRGDVTQVSQPWGPIPGIVAVHNEPADFFDEPGRSRILENSDGSTVVETITAIDPPHRIDYTITDLTSFFRHLTSGARPSITLEAVDDHETRVSWHYTWDAHNALTLPLVWLIAHLAFRPYMKRMLEGIGRSAAGSRRGA